MNYCNELDSCVPSLSFVSLKLTDGLPRAVLNSAVDVLQAQLLFLRWPVP
jgi:hypothetical protein